MPSPRAISSLVQSRNVDIRVANSTRFKQTTYLIVLSFSVRLCFFSLCFRFFIDFDVDRWYVSHSGACGS